jgi:exosortase/archaeosortase family protein
MIVTVQDLTRIEEAVMVNVMQAVKRNVGIIMTLLPILSFVAPLLILYSLHAWTFEQTYHGRTLLLVFLWLLLLEMILGWEKLQSRKVNKLRSIRTFLFIISLLLPATYVIAANYYGINTMIGDLTSRYVAPLAIAPDQKLIIASQMPINIEYVVFAALLCLIILLAYGISNLPEFSISIVFLGIIGLLFVTDQLYPGKFTPLQIFVPSTATLAANVLNLMGYQTTLSFATNMPLLIAVDPMNTQRFAGFYIDWTCSGVESLLIYTLTILLFLRKTTIPWKYRTAYFAFGAVVTYFINALRIVTIFLIAMPEPPSYTFNEYAFQRFHNFYGMLYSISWILAYPLIIIGSQALWRKLRNSRVSTKTTFSFPTQTKLPE